MDCCSSSTAPVMLPRSLYSGCSILVKLKLKKVVLVDVTSPFSFPSLKKLTLKSVKYPDDEFVQRLLSNCPVLESLYVKQCIDDNVTIFTVKVPSLKSLVLDNLVFRSTDIGSGYVIDAPSLERFTLHDAYEDRFCVIENEMPNIVEAYVDVAYSHPGTILSSITSVKHLTLCITSSEVIIYLTIHSCLYFFTICILDFIFRIGTNKKCVAHHWKELGVLVSKPVATNIAFVLYSVLYCLQDAYPVGIVFCSLVYLEIWAMETEWSADLNLLMCVLRNSPNLRALKLEQINSVPRQPRSCWREPSSVPECVIWSLETLEWIEYEGAEEEKKIIEFILRNAKCLKKATISTDSTDPNEKLEMLKALSLFPRRSPTCQLAFD
ncbi:F-box-like domain superfamily [Arabidopsis suecica]|nr:F-box-like domain superfamily [Arabidopsis suecica]